VKTERRSAISKQLREKIFFTQPLARAKISPVHLPYQPGTPR
jgi:hypothetical protein